MYKFGVFIQRNLLAFSVLRFEGKFPLSTMFWVVIDHNVDYSFMIVNLGTQTHQRTFLKLFFLGKLNEQTWKPLPVVDILQNNLI